MPKILLYRKPTFITDDMVGALTLILREEAAPLLSSPSAGEMITPMQIEVWVHDGHPLDDNTCDLSIEVQAGDVSGRGKTGPKIIKTLAEAVGHIVPHLVGNPLRSIDTWIELDLGQKYGRKIWP